MSEKKKRAEPRRVDTGGGAYIGGDIHVGHDFVGRDQVHVTSGVTLDQFQALLVQIRQALPQAGLEPEIIEVIDADFRVIEEQTQKEQPDKAIVVSKLQGINEVLKTGAAAATIATASVKLAPLVERAIQLAQQLL